MTDTERRAPLDEQPIALALAEAQGTLPAEDRRMDTPAEAIVYPESWGVKGDFDLARHIADGYQFTKNGAEWTATLPSGETGHGTTPEEAIANVGAVILPDADGLRVLHRRDGSTVRIDGAN